METYASRRLLDSHARLVEVLNTYRAISRYQEYLLVYMCAPLSLLQMVWLENGLVKATRYGSMCPNARFPWCLQ